MHCEQTIEELDLERETLETLLCYLESAGHLKVMLNSNTCCNIRCSEGIRQIAKLARVCPIISMALQMKNKKEKISHQFSFSTVKVANNLRMSLSDLRRTLRKIPWDSNLSTDRSDSKSGISVEFSDTCFVVKICPKINSLDEICNYLFDRVNKQQNKDLNQLQFCYQTMKKFSKPNINSCLDNFNAKTSEDMKVVIDSYFEKPTDDLSKPEVNFYAQPDSSIEHEIRNLTNSFLMVHGGDVDKDCNGRVLARIFHGISSPRYPSKSWGPARKFWRNLIHVDFNFIIKIATQEIIKWRL